MTKLSTTFFRCMLAAAVVAVMQFAPPPAYAAEPPVVIGGTCTTLGATKLADNQQGVLFCVQKAGFPQGTYYWIAGIAPPTCGTGTALSFDGTKYICVATGGGGGGSRIQCTSNVGGGYYDPIIRRECVDVQTGDFCTITTSYQISVNCFKRVPRYDASVGNTFGYDYSLSSDEFFSRR